jgi:transcriptional regulator with XRE-family HTH domain
MIRDEIVVDYKSLGYLIRKRRTALHITRQTLANAADISVSFLGHIERGSRRASIQTLMMLANALYTTLSSLVGEVLAEGVTQERQALTNALNRAPQAWQE